MRDPLAGPSLLDEPADHGIGRSRGGLSTKTHQLVDDAGLPLVRLITPGRAEDSPMLLPLLGQLRVTRPAGRPRVRPDAVLVDKAYSLRAIRAHLRSRDSRPSPLSRRTSRAAASAAVPAEAAHNGPNVIKRHSVHLKQWWGLATRYDKYSPVNRAAVVVAAVITA